MCLIISYRVHTNWNIRYLSGGVFLLIPMLQIRFRPVSHILSTNFAAYSLYALFNSAVSLFKSEKTNQKAQ